MAGILDDYFNPALYGGQGGGILSRLPELLAQPGQSQGFPDGQQGAPGSLDPRWLEWLKGGPVPGGAPQAPQAQAPIFPPGMGSMGGASGYGAGMDAPQQPDQGQLPPTSMPVQSPSPIGMPAGPQGQQAPQAQPAPPAGPGMLDRLTAGATNFTTGGNPIAGLLNMVSGLSTGQRTDPGGIAQQNQVATAHALYSALSKTGRYTPEEAKGIAIAAAGNPALATALLPQAFGTKYDFKPVKDALGGETLMAVNPITGTAKPVTGEGGGENSVSPGGPTMLAPGVKKYDPTLSGPDYMNQFGPEVQSIAKMFLKGDQMPTGNPRIQGIIPFAKTVAAKYAQDMGIPFSDEVYAGKRKFHTELGSNSAGTAGGQAKAFVQGIEHALDLADTLKKLDNSNGLGIPVIAQGVNTVRQAISNDQQALADKAQGIGQTLAGEVGKLFSGSAGGGVHEREMTRARFDTVRSKPQLAAALEATLETMEGGLTAIENRRDQMLGPASGVELVPQQTRQKIDQLRGIISDLKGQAPAKGAAPSHGAPAVSEGATATNPQTGQKIMFRGGQWVPAQ